MKGKVTVHKKDGTQVEIDGVYSSMFEAGVDDWGRKKSFIISGNQRHAFRSIDVADITYEGE